MKKKKLTGYFCPYCEYIILSTKEEAFCNCNTMERYNDEGKVNPIPRSFGWKQVQISISSIHTKRKERVKAGKWIG